MPSLCFTCHLHLLLSRTGERLGARQIILLSSDLGQCVHAAASAGAPVRDISEYLTSGLCGQSRSEYSTNNSHSIHRK